MFSWSSPSPAMGAAVQPKSTRGVGERRSCLSPPFPPVHSQIHGGRRKGTEHRGDTTAAPCIGMAKSVQVFLVGLSMFLWEPESGCCLPNRSRGRPASAPTAFRPAGKRYGVVVQRSQPAHGKAELDPDAEQRWAGGRRPEARGRRGPASEGVAVTSTRLPRNK